MRIYVNIISHLHVLNQPFYYIFASLPNKKFRALKLQYCFGIEKVTEDYIRSIFKEQTGMTPNQMLSETRLNNARNIILYSKTDIPISNIALDSGFDDLAYFSKAFKKRYGMAPTEYKSKYGKSKA